MWRILQCPEPDDYILATGETHSVREFVEKAFAQIGVKIVWQGAGLMKRELMRNRAVFWSRSIHAISARPRLIF